MMEIEQRYIGGHLVVFTPVFTVGECYENPEGNTMTVTATQSLEGVQKVFYTSSEGEQGWFYSNDEEITRNIELVK